jgi:hypothetical protein
MNLPLFHYIPDGQTTKAFIAGIPNIHGDAHIEFRPMLHDEQYALARELPRLDAKTASKVIVESVCRFVVSWDCKKPDGSPVAREFEDVKRMPSQLVARLYSIISGWDGGDLEAGARIAQSESEASLDSILGSKTIGEAREENSLKNSPTA